MLRNLPQQWDMEADFVSVGSGCGGLSGAIAAHDHGARAIVLERTDQVGGVTAYSMGEVWVPGNSLAAELGLGDSVESGMRYVRKLALGYAEDVAIANQAVNGPAALAWFQEHIGLKMRVIRNCPDYYFGFSNDAVAEGRLLEADPFPGEALGEWQYRTRVSPHVLYGFTHDDIFANGGTANLRNWDFSRMGERLAKDERCLGPGLAAYFVKGALDRGIPMLTGVSVEELVGDGERVIGVRASRDGQDFFVKANKGVLIAVSSYERNPVFARTMGQQLAPQSVVMPAVDGAHFRLAGMVGARVARVPDLTMLGFCMPGEELEEGIPFWRNMMSYSGLPHSIVVNRKGRRFADESFYRSLYFAVDAVDGADQTHPNFPCWAVIDAQAREKYPFGSAMPGGDLPIGHKADTLEELAALAGIDPAGLVDTVARFNEGCARGEDPEFQRGTHPWGAWMTGDRFHQPNPNLGPLSKGPYYAVELSRLASSAIAASGVVVNEHNQAMGWNGQPIAGLYLAGNSVARLDTGALMQSGMSNARGMTHGWLAARHAAGQPSDLLDKAIAAGILEAMA